LDALLEELWLGDHFIAKLALSGRVVESQSLILCMPILLGERLPVGVRASLAARIESFLSEYGPATEHPASTKYVSDGYWRGPIWAPSTYIIVSGLERSGHRDLARRIAHRFCSLCTRSGFAENFDALTGEPLRDPAYTWTSSVFLLLAEWLREVGSKDEGL
jgi:glycogen debranching enzyme